MSTNKNKKKKKQIPQDDFNKDLDELMATLELAKTFDKENIEEEDEDNENF